MRLSRRGGFTLVEMMVAMLLAGIVLAAGFSVLVSMQRTTQRLAQRIDMDQNLRAAVTYLSSAIQELDATDGDIVALASNAIRFRRMQWTGVVCSAPVLSGTDVQISIQKARYFGWRDPDPTLDSLLIFSAEDPTTKDDDRWLTGAVRAVDNGVCSDGSAAANITVAINAASGGANAAVVGVAAGAPMRGFQVEDLLLVQRDGDRWWLGQRMANRSGVWTTVQPLIGPLWPTGFDLTFRDATGAATTARDEVVSVDLTVRGKSRRTVRTGAGTLSYLRDSLSTSVALRNNPRF